MSTALPSDVRERIRRKVWAKADTLGWSGMSDADRSVWYENWTKDKDVGGVLSHFMDARRVRVYIKDSLIKPYLRSRLRDGWGMVMLALGMAQNDFSIIKSYDKPYGRQLQDGRIVCWGNSRDWKSILFSVFERAYQTQTGISYAAVMMETGKTSDPDTRKMIRDAGQRLGVRLLEWID